ncbi:MULTISPECIES: nicotinate-nucleotide--dimethylbenzimidazole phosphoribosyltransferase [Desulfosediminicola]|uniref:nicotinate-nucleotide--dimethylbenzimidazole phosphoribosyltransferase n=1 Tax=Desulfosediminicola TaxID=2886823 RepID=UPI0010AC796C|nr:nicotinate-nucleotide--dimethylbenzimidazole phosphoribosyltransferase [Desulfosediminicola ganghwensis]
MQQRIQLTAIQQLSSTSVNPKQLDQPTEGHIRLKVLYCAICRTDAKMWKSGHRDLKLPRVLGHEVAAINESSGELFTIWPGQACWKCSYCLNGRDNLCEEMKIIGFHSDGGFSSWLDVPNRSLIPAEGIQDPRLLVFTEPIACVLHCLATLNISGRERVIIYGGGTVGLLTALACQVRGCMVTVIEQSEEKIAKTTPFTSTHQIAVVKDTVDSDFDLAINCCDSPIACALCITKLKKGGKLGFFSGLKKNEELDTNLLNLLHYKENQLIGSYGPTRADMFEAVKFCRLHGEGLLLLIEKFLTAEDAASVMPAIADGNALKYVLDFSSDTTTSTTFSPGPPARAVPSTSNQSAANSLLSLPLTNLIRKIQPLSEEIRTAAQKKIDMKTKPLGALGKIERLAVRIAAIQSNLMPRIENKQMVVFAGDHGVVEEGVSAYPSKVTKQMVENFLDGGAAINAFCRQFDISLKVVDMGVKGQFAAHPLLIHGKVREGTSNFTLQQAMTIEEAVAAMEVGAQVFSKILDAGGCDVIGLGEMGIGNTSSASAIISLITGTPVAELTGRGTGVDNKGLERKIEVLEKALHLHRLKPHQPIEILAAVGGFELCGIAGCVLAAAAHGKCVVLDGLISTAAGLVVYQICPDVGPYLIAGHRSVEQGQIAALQHMNLHPVVDMEMRLGEGTGAALTINMIELAARVMREMATFEEAGIEAVHR